MTRRRLLALLVAAALGVAPGPRLPASTATVATAPLATSVPEYNAKAGYLLLFARYTQWPAAAFASPQDPIVVAVLGENPFGNVLARTLEGQTQDGRPFVAVQVETPAEAARAHVVFVARGQARQQAEWFAALRGRPVLIVADAPEALSQGAAIAFATESGPRGQRLRFEASLAAAEAAGLRLESPLLSAARRVVR
jgi:hypothetical protein